MFDKSAVNLLGFPFYVNSFFHLAACNLLSLSFATLITMCLESFLLEASWLGHLGFLTLVRRTPQLWENLDYEFLNY